MGPKAEALVAEVIDRLESRPPGTGRPPLPTLKVVEALRFFVREGVPSGAAIAVPFDRDRGRPCGPTPPTPPCVRVRTRRFVGSSGLWDQWWEAERSQRLVRQGDV